MSPALLGLAARVRLGSARFPRPLPCSRRRADSHRAGGDLLRTPRAQRLAFDGGGAVTIVRPAIWLIAVTGMVFTLATLSLFSALALGPFSIVAPLAGSYPALAMIFTVAQGPRPSLAQWLAITAMMGGVVIVSRSGGYYEASGHLPPGKLKTCSALALSRASALLFL